MTEKTIYILGAGSTISSTDKLYPDINNIFNKANEFNITVSSKGILDDSFKELETFLNDSFNYSLLSKHNILDFEKVFTIIDIEEEKNKIKFGLLRSQLLFLLYKLFMKLKNEINTFEETEYVKFTKILNAQDSIITFNWDVLLDDALNRESILYHQFNYDLGKEPNRYALHGDHYCSLLSSIFKKSSEIDLTYRVLGSITGKYIKLHGSVDWNICKNPFCDFYSKPIPTLLPLENRTCRACFETCDTLLIPPTFKKSINQVPFIRNQWNVASEEISKATKMVIWGYQIPPTDFYSEWLFMKVRKNRKLKEIIIINPCEKHRNRFKELFNSLGVKAKYSEFKYYKDFIKNISKIK